MQHYCVYILECNDGSYYVGHTDNMEVRLAAHEDGHYPSCYTYMRRPLKLVYCDLTSSRDEAFAFERRIKKWSREKKQALIEGDWEKISMLAKKKFKK